MTHPANMSESPSTDTSDHSVAIKLKVEGLRKTYGTVVALDSVDLKMVEGEFLTLLGPSGSGKSTLLWAVAGLNNPDSGRIWLDGREATYAPPQERDIGMVFQNYALFPHLSIAENVAFPLKMRRKSSTDISAAVKNALNTVQLSHVEDRLPAELSGGQQQRIALARAMVYEPSVILMDEPLGALDKKLRDHLQIEIKELHERLGVTILYVTHDQEEALVMSDRICLMKDARIEQIGTSDEIYRRPRTHFAADFLGESNILPIESDGAGVGRLSTGEAVRFDAELAPKGPLSLMIRPDAVRILDVGANSEGIDCVMAKIESRIMAGAITKLFATLSDGTRFQANLLTGSTPAGVAPGASVTLGWSSDAAVPFLREKA